MCLRWMSGRLLANSAVMFYNLYLDVYAYYEKVSKRDRHYISNQIYESHKEDYS